MSVSVDILFLDSQRLGAPGSLEQIVDIFLKFGFQFTEFFVNDVTFSSSSYLDEYKYLFECAYQCQSLSFKAISSSPYLEVFQQIAWGEEQMGKAGRAYIRTSTDSASFLGHTAYDNEGYSALFLEIGLRLYYELKPTFGWIDFYHGWTTTHEDIESLQLRNLYWANFFGDRFVQKIGKDKIMKGPAWNIKLLEDGGILYLIAPHLGVTGTYITSEQLNSYFGWM